MRFIRGSQCVVWGSLAALFYGGPANPGRGVTAAIVAPDRPAARASAEEGFSLASQEQKTALAEAGTAKAREPRLRSRLTELHPPFRTKWPLRLIRP